MARVLGPRRPTACAHAPAAGNRGGRAWSAARGWPATAAVSLLACGLGWRDIPWRVAAPGLDSWQAALALGYQHHLQWGPQMVFTFGPFGFAEDVLPYFRATAAIGLVYSFAVTWGLAMLVVSFLRPSWRLLPAGAVAWGTVALEGNVLEASQLATATALGLALACLRASTARSQAALLCGLGGLAGFEMLVEISPGLVCTGLLAVSLLALLAEPGPRRRLLAGVAAYVGVPLVALVGAGQSLSNLPSYLYGSLQVVLGYGAAMATSTGRVAEDWYGVAEAALLAGIAAAALRHRPRAEKVAVGLMLAGWAWAALKEGYVRHDTHDVTFLGLAMVGMALFRLPRRWSPAQAGALATSALMVCAANAGAPASLSSPLEDVSSLATEVANLAVTSQWERAQSIGRFQERLLGGVLPVELLHQLAGRTMAAEPWEDSLAFTYPQLRWAPEPVAQAYSAYTVYLDQLDARFLLGPRAPQRLLFQQVAIDGRNPYWAPPAATEAMLCRYNQIGTVQPAAHRVTHPPTPVLGDSAWQVLALGPDRCGPASALGTVTARFGASVAVPAPLSPGEMVLARFSFGAPLLARVEGALLKPPPVYLQGLAGDPEVPVRYRLVAGTAGDMHVLTTPPSLGYSLAYSPPQVHSLELAGGGWPAGGGKVTVSFFEVPIRR